MALHAARAIRQKHQKAEKAEKASSSSSSSTSQNMLDSEFVSPEQRKQLEEAFEAADKNGDGVLTVDEYHDIFLSHGLSIGEFYVYYLVFVAGFSPCCGKYSN